MKDWIHISHIASCGAGGVCFSLLPSPSLLHSLCKCNRRITRDKALHSRDMMPPFCEDRGIQTYLTWCNQQSELCCVICLSHWLLGNLTTARTVWMLGPGEILSTNIVTRQLINGWIQSVFHFKMNHLIITLSNAISEAQAIHCRAFTCFFLFYFVCLGEL